MEDVCGIGSEPVSVGVAAALSVRDDDLNCFGSGSFFLPLPRRAKALKTSSSSSEEDSCGRSGKARWRDILQIVAVWDFNMIFRSHSLSRAADDILNEINDSHRNKQTKIKQHRQHQTVMNRLIALVCLSAHLCDGFAFVATTTQRQQVMERTMNAKVFPPASIGSLKLRTSSMLQMVDQNVLVGGGIAVAGLAAGIALVAFTETQGERAKERGSGLSDGMATRITGQLMEDVEVSSVDDLGSLTSQLEKALKESGGAKEDEFEMTEEEKKRIEAEADDGW